MLNDPGSQDIISWIADHCSGCNSADVMNAAMWHYRRIPVHARDDFLSIVLLEILEETACSGIMNLPSVKRAFDRVRHRLLRDLKKRAAVNLNDLDFIDVSSDLALAIESDEREEKMANVLRALDPLNLAIFAEVIAGREFGEVAKILGRSKRTIIDRVKEIAALIEFTFGTEAE